MAMLVMSEDSVRSDLLEIDEGIGESLVVDLELEDTVLVRGGEDGGEGVAFSLHVESPEWIDSHKLELQEVVGLVRNPLSSSVLLNVDGEEDLVSLLPVLLVLAVGHLLGIVQLIDHVGGSENSDLLEGPVKSCLAHFEVGGALIVLPDRGGVDNGVVGAEIHGAGETESMVVLSLVASDESNISAESLD